MSPTRRRTTRVSSKTGRRVLVLEALEARTLLTTVSWSGGGDKTSWSDPNNWSDHAVPTSSDDVTINVGGNPTIQISAVESVNSLMSSDPLSISNGSLAIAASSTLSGGLTMTGGSLIANGSGAIVNVTGTTSISGASLYAQGGATLNLPDLESFTANSSTFEAQGASSVLNVSGLTTVSGAGWGINVSDGGEMNLSGMNAISVTGSLSDTGSSTLVDPNLASLSDFSALLDGTDTQAAGAWTSFLSGSLTVTGGAYSLSKLTDVNQSSINVMNGGSLTLPELTSFTANANTFEAQNAGSVLNVSALTTVTGGGWGLTAATGGELNISGLASFAIPGQIIDTGNSTIVDPKLSSLTGVNATLDGTDTQVAGAWTQFLSATLDATGPSVQLPALTDLDGSSLIVESNASLSVPALVDDTPNENTFQVHTGGTLTLGALTTVLGSNTLTVNDSGGTLNLPVLTAGSIILDYGSTATIQGTVVGLPATGTSGATINAPATNSLDINLLNTGTLTGGTTFNVGQGTTIDLTGGTFTGGATFNVGQGGVVDLTGGQTTTYGGTLTGTGAGTVQFTSGGIDPAEGSGDGPGNAGLTLNFPVGMFQWTGGDIFAAVGNVTNLGTMNLAGASDKGFVEDGTLYNEGTIVQTGTGNLDLHSDNVSPTTFVNDSGASYLIESNSGIDNVNGGQVAVVNAGTIRKTAGTGTSTLGINGPLTNTGTIESDSGTLDVEPTSIAELSGTTLTAGTWNALGGSALLLPSGTSITDNEATITLSGTGASFPALSSLTTNSGSLTLGAGATLSLSGSYTQTSAGTLGVQVGGAPASGQFGQLAVTGTANLAGTLAVSLVNGFTPSGGQDFPVLTFAQSSGDFATFTGLGGNFTQTLNATSLDLIGVAAPSDLAVTSVTAPTAATAGQPITVDWQVTDQNNQNATGTWQDSVYLSPTPTIGATSVLLGSVAHTGGLAAGASYNGNLTAAVPALAPGYEYVLVLADSLYQVPDVNRANNTLAAGTGQLDVSVPALTLGTPASGSFTAADQDQYYQVTVPAGGSVQFALTSTAGSGALALYVSQGMLPTSYNAQEAAVVPNSPAQTLTVPQVLTAGTYYVDVHSVAGAAATSGFTLSVTRTSAVTVSATSPSSGGNAGNVTIEIDGTNFTPSTTASLTLGSTVVNASAIDFVSASQMYATFDLSGAAIGDYTVNIDQSGQHVSAQGTFSVTAATPGTLDLVVDTPQYVRSGRDGTIVISYSNPTSNDLVAPLIAITTTNANVLFSTTDDPNDFVQSVQVLAVASNGPAGILRPGQSGQITLNLLSRDTINNDTIPVQVSQIAPNQSINWAAAKTTLQPNSVSAAAWNVIFSNFLSEVGSTVGSYNDALAQAATYLSGLGEATGQVSSVGALSSFLIGQADASFPGLPLSSAVDASLSTPGSLSLAIDRTFISSIAGRYTQGMFGLGWATSWQTSLSVDASGNVTIDSGNAFALFTKQANGTYLDTDGVYGTLTLAGGTYTFTDTSGSQYVFLANRQLNYVQDTNGNRITLGYNGGDQLVSLTYSNPSSPAEPTEQLTLSYNGQGFVSQVADGTGDTWSYQYDSAGHLLSVTAPGNMTTSYAYDTGSNAETTNALLSITNPDGSMQNFEYDAQGRLIETSQNGGADAIAYTYDGQAEVTATDAGGNSTTVWFNDLGLAARIEDALGDISSYFYDDSGNLVSYTDAAGGTFQYAYDQNGNLTQTVNPLGQTVEMSYGTLDDLTSITDAAGNTTQYGYSASGNLLSITYPDGTSQSFTYDPLGNLSETVEQNGDAVSEQSNAQGLVTSETFADGTSETFAYDAHGNLLTAQTYAAGGALTGTTTLTYNAANELTSVAYPGGLSLNFTYNAQGQRTQSVDQTGFTVNYSYDALGRLSKLTDGSGDTIVQYTYNNLGELSKKVNGNGTSTTYAYDAVGDLTQEVNYAPDGTTVNSSFTYTYNALGEMTSMTDASGATTSYGYDATGQLTSVTLPGGQTTTYVYNAAGDRTEVISGGTTTTYSSNADNEITQVGTATYTYDANGNLASVTDSSGTTTYTYNDLNQLVSITAPGDATTTFQYSPLGFLVGQNVGGSQTNYLVDPTGIGNTVASYDGSGSLIANYTYGIGLVSQTSPSGTGYYDFDASGNTIGITGVGGTYVNQYSYLPFGETTTIAAALPNLFTFAGQVGVMQIGSNLFNMRARDYTPATGQFLSNDPVGLGGGDVNVRRYAGNAPLAATDPTGLAPDLESTVASTILSNTFFESGDVYKVTNASEQVQANLQVMSFRSGETLEWFKQTGLRESTKRALQIAEDRAQAAKAAANAERLLAGGAPEALLLAPATELSINYFQDINSLLPQQWKDAIGDALYGIFGPGVENIQNLLRNISNALSNDPNALIGPGGYGSQGFVGPASTLPYTIDFENDGSAAAEDVTVTEQLDPNLDWSTFQLGSFGFGPVNVNIPAGLTQYQTTVAYQNTDGSALNVLVALDFNVQTGLLTVTFTSLDPTTGQAPTGVFDGFLPPNNSTDVGEGYVQYTVRAKSTASTGTTITQQASVVFDTNAPLNTATVTNTIDAGPPTSTVAALPATVGVNFPVSWSGSSDPGGSGVGSYTIFVSDNGGPFIPWLTDTTQTSATYDGAYGHTYAFYSVATDNVGNVQATPASAQASTQVVATPLQVTSISPSADFLTSLPNNQIVVTFNRALAGLVPDKSGGTGFASDPFAVMLIPSGPSGLATQKATGVFWSAPSGYDSGDLPIPATAVYHVNSNGTSTITLTPDQPLATDIYLITVNNVTDTYGDPLAINAAGTAGNVYASFDYRPSPVNHTAPTVTGVSTKNGTVAINNNSIPQPDTIGIAFSKPMDTYTINSSTVQLFEKGVNGALAAAVTYSPTTQSAYLTPEVKLEPGALYYVSVSTGVTDDQGFPSSGDPLAQTFVTSFTVSGAPAGSGTSPLTVKQTDPVNNTEWTASLGYGAVTFSEPISLSSLSRFSAMLVPQTGSAVRGAGAYADVPVNAQIAFNPGTNQLIIVPTGLLRNDTIYLFELSGITATNGNTLAGTVFSTFLLNTSTPAHVASVEPQSTPVATIATPAVLQPSAPAAPARHAVAPRPVYLPVRPAQAVLATSVPTGPRRFFRGR